MIFFILILISAIFKALMDNLQFHYDRIRIGFMAKNPQYWNPQISWENKYKYGENKPKWVKWVLKNTLVFVTDGWHLSQFLFLNSVFISILFYINDCVPKQPIFYLIDFLIFRLAFGFVFSIFYNYIWVRKKV